MRFSSVDGARKGGWLAQQPTNRALGEGTGLQSFAVFVL
jgi:hypothetical protein